MMVTKLQAVRKERQLTAFQVAKLSGIHPANLSKIENGRMVPSKNMKAALLSLYSLPEDELFEATYGMAK